MILEVAAKKCSVEEVQDLHRELQEWLASNKQGDKVRPSFRRLIVFISSSYACSYVASWRKYLLYLSQLSLRPFVAPERLPGGIFLP